MAVRRFTILASAMFLLCSFAIAQTEPISADLEKDKKKKEIDERVMQLLDQAVGESNTLRLPQNRAIVYAISGDLYWKFDDKRSRELFRSAAAEIVTFNQESEKEKRESTNAFSDVFDFSSNVRSEILPLIAKRDAELALELLLQTRPAKLTEAMAKAAMPNAKAGADMMSFNPDKMRVSQELALEQHFALLAADENPDKAIKLIKESLAKGISPNVIPLLQKLFKKDEKKATELAGDVVKKLVDSDLAKNDDDMRAATMFLQFAFKPAAAASTKEKTFAFTDAQIKDLAGKMATALLQPSRSMTMAMMLGQLLPMLEKFAPDKAGPLKQRQAENEAGMPPEFKRMQEQQKLWSPNSTPDEILAQLPKLQNEYEKISAYQSLTQKIGEIEDETRAKRLIDQIPDEKTRTAALDAFEATRIERTAASGKLDEARKLIGNLTKKKIQIQRLVALALSFHKKGGEKDIAAAKGLMKDARALTSESAETTDDIADIVEVVRGYASIDADTAFRLFEPVVDQINEHLQASAVLAKFNSQSSAFKKGELVMKVSGNQWDSPLFRFIPQMQLLGKADLERMNTLADRFGRNDSRTLVKLYVLQGFLKDDKKSEDSQPNQGFNIIF